MDTVAILQVVNGVLLVLLGLFIRNHLESDKAFQEKTREELAKKVTIVECGKCEQRTGDREAAYAEALKQISEQFGARLKDGDTNFIALHDEIRDMRQMFKTQLLKTARIDLMSLRFLVRICEATAETDCSELRGLYEHMLETDFKDTVARG